ncbi:hypothetical protein R1538_34785 [Rhizobium leguminosarum]|uniref:hypothetical protein n=1 Tax=Rhizobium leguminosarum TaxID=384 RepID=UPI00293DCCB4|nr:hypothetical protein [Rhizobium leguminosarum]MDV4166219.1 hypothetical protein [Rhizobium leguminosarum]
MKRFDFFEAGKGYAERRECPDGPFCYYDEASAIVMEQVEKLRAAIDRCGMTDVVLERLEAAIEGECDGLAISREQAVNILSYALFGIEPADRTTGRLQ